MPIRRFFGSRVFQPELTHVMGDVFDIICKMQRLNPRVDDRATRQIADAVISAAQENEPDGAALLGAALAKLGIGSPEKPAA
jgi:hypothetical protein